MVVFILLTSTRLDGVRLALPFNAAGHRRRGRSSDGRVGVVDGRLAWDAGIWFALAFDLWSWLSSWRTGGLDLIRKAHARSMRLRLVLSLGQGISRAFGGFLSCWQILTTSPSWKFNSCALRDRIINHVPDLLIFEKGKESSGDFLREAFLPVVGIADGNFQYCLLQAIKLGVRMSLDEHGDPARESSRCQPLDIRPLIMPLLNEMVLAIQISIHPRD